MLSRAAARVARAARAARAGPRGCSARGAAEGRGWRTLATSARATSAQATSAQAAKAAAQGAAAAAAQVGRPATSSSLKYGALAACAGVWALGGGVAYAIVYKETATPAHAEPAAAGSLEADGNDEVLTSKFTYYSGRTLADPSKTMIFSGNGNVPLAEDIAKYLGVSLGNMNVSSFADGECSIKVNENIRGKHVILVQSTCPPSVNDSLMELLLMISTMRRSSAKTITVVMPYCGYARSDMKRGRERSPIAARDIMTMIETMGADRLVCVDMHSGQMQGFLSPAVPSDNITAIKVGALYFAEKMVNVPDSASEDAPRRNVVVVAPDEKAVSRAKEFWNVLIEKGVPEARFAMVLRKPNLEEQERKEQPQTAAAVSATSVGTDPSTALEHEIVGDEEAIADCDAIIVQDIIDSGQSMSNAASALKAGGARNVYGFATHGLFSRDALERIDRALLDHVVVSNTASHPIGYEDKPTDKITWISIAPLLAEVLRIISEKESLNPVFRLPKEQQ